MCSPNDVCIARDVLPSNAVGEEEDKWDTLSMMMEQGPFCSEAQEEAAAMDAAAERIQVGFGSEVHAAWD